MNWSIANILLVFMRLMSLVSLGIAAYTAVLTLSVKQDSNIGLYITAIFIVGAFAPRSVEVAVQKITEVRMGVSK